MAVMKTCCCFSNVRTGSFACAIYTLVLSLVNAGLVGYNLINYHELEVLISTLDETATNHTMSFTNGDAVKQSSMQHIIMAKGWFFTTLVLAILLFVTSIVLIIGIHRDNRLLLLPWILVVILMIIIDTAALMYNCITFGLLTFNIVVMVLWLALSLLNIYGLLCVVSQYQELKAGRGTVEYFQQLRAQIYYQAHFTQGPILMTGSATAHMMTSSSTLQAVSAGRPTITATLMLSPPATYSQPAPASSSLAAASAAGARAPSGDAAHNANLVISPPDYCVASSQLPQYTEASATSADPLLAAKESTADSPPPPYRP